MRLQRLLILLLILAALGVGFGLNALVSRSRVSEAPALSTSSGAAAESLQAAFVSVASSVKPAVVNIGTVQHSKGRNPFDLKPFGSDDPFFKEFFEHFFGQGPGAREFRQPGLGSGVIIDKKGYILTNFHVIRGADEITVKLSSRREYRGRVVGSDPKTDLAVVKFQPDGDLATARLGDSDRLRVGEWAIAIGNPFGLDQTVTVGVISATGRSDVGIATYENFIQTDASINPGNSGGPLLNLAGEVIGINTAIVAAGQGIGFAIPINMVKRAIPQLIEKGKVVRGWIGIAVQPLTAELARSLGATGTTGAVVAKASPGSPAAEAALRPGDLIIAFDGTPVEDYRHLQRLVADTEVGRTVTLQLLRRGEKIAVKVRIAETPGDGTRKPG
jgi:Do/DeqQ family serine protease